MDRMHAKDTVDIMLHESAAVWDVGLEKNKNRNFLVNWGLVGNLEKLSFKTIQCYCDIMQFEKVDCICFLRKHISYLHSLSSRCSILEQRE